MSEIKKIKIPFTKKSIKQIPAKDLNPGAKGIELEVKTDFLMSQICSLEGIVHGPIQDTPFEKIAFVFKNDAEKAVYDALLDNNSQNFELSFNKEKVFLMVFGFGNLIDKTKPEVQVSPGHKSMVVFFDSKFAGIITLESKDGDEDKKEDKKSPDISIVRKYCQNNEVKNLTYDEETDKLTIEYKKDKPNRELTDLAGELAEIKRYLLKSGKLKGKKRMLDEADWTEKNNQTQTEKTNWVPWAIGGGIVALFLIVLVAIVGLTRKGDN